MENDSGYIKSYHIKLFVQYWTSTVSYVTIDNLFYNDGYYLYYGRVHQNKKAWQCQGMAISIIQG